jgi:hypothetical protein
MNRPGASDDQGEHSAYRDRLDNQAKGLIVVDAGLLGEAMKAQRALYHSKEASKLNL